MSPGLANACDINSLIGCPSAHPARWLSLVGKRASNSGSQLMLGRLRSERVIGLQAPKRRDAMR